MKIENFIVRKDVNLTKTPFQQIHLSRLKFLTRPLNWLLRCLHAYDYTNSQTHPRLQIDIEDVTRKLRVILHEYTLFTGKYATHIVIGYDKLNEITRDYEPYMGIQTLNMDHIFGCKLILHPQINGMFTINIE